MTQPVCLSMEYGFACPKQEYICVCVFGGFQGTHAQARACDVRRRCLLKKKGQGKKVSPMCIGIEFVWQFVGFATTSLCA
jgi:hypothetical protein